MLLHTHSPASPWTIVKADDKKTARLNLISDLLTRFDYEGKKAKVMGIVALKEHLASCGG